MNKLTIDDLDIKGKRVLVRVDFNVPIEDGKVANDNRIVASLPTIKKILESGGSAVLMSHLGRPKGKPDPTMSLKPVAYNLSQHLDKPVNFADDCISEDALRQAEELKPGEVLLLENLRFHEGEKGNDPDFAEKLSKLGELYVDDAFGTAHRAHASTEGVTKYFEKAAAGYLMVKEIEYLGHAVENPERPMAAILGGAKISGKIDVINNLIEKVEKIFIGGGMAFTFFKAQGLEIGKSLLEEDRVEMAEKLLKKAQSKEIEISLPVDVVCAKDLSKDAETKTVPVDQIPSNMAGYDIGPETLKKYKQDLSDCKTIVWNGPMGVFEKEKFAKGTVELAKALAELTSNGATTIIGGGDSASAVKKAGVGGKLSHISTGGGASLEFLEGKTLPGLAALTDK
ncbi:MAG: phosphoglycerate kinase [candidate division Zixibacteria bacterium]|nr:phosphoglycerate kinase [candidate division Zixibacteria bacterium]NIR67676.1 phosphoglycerate kinase [candidate division Zixibacteria bacterium]NIS17893.1 phosphoglycerate kinase [candidate division Zixibacteria bacterium]NIS47949.1 phosphoglycerate kinase [candidate division Zixibacteria bacterium]NIT54174.1 phosphoglycerate kinase [candidate division Zixibacteria bacterium]